MGYKYCGEYTKLLGGDDVETVKPLSVEDGGDPLNSNSGSAFGLKRKKWSCCKWTMCILLSLIVFFLASTLLVMTFGYFWTRHQVVRFTSTEPLDLPIHPLPDAELNLFLDRAKLFRDTIQAGKVPEQDLTMTVEEMNGFIAHSDCMRGNAFVEVTENKLSADMSIPAEHFPGGKGRFFVASGFVSVQEEGQHPEDDTVDADTISNKAIVTTKLDTHYPVKDMDGPFLLGQFDVFSFSGSTLLSSVVSWSMPLAANSSTGSFPKITLQRRRISSRAFTKNIIITPTITIIITTTTITTKIAILLSF